MPRCLKLEMVALDLRSLVRQEKARQLAQQAAANVPRREDAAEMEAVEQRPISLAEHSIASERLDGLSYVPEFLSREDEATVLRCVDAAPSARWVACGERRILVHPEFQGASALSSTKT